MSNHPCTHIAWLVLACAATQGCQEPCPPNTVQSGKLCLFKRDAAAADGGGDASLDPPSSAWSCTAAGLACVCSQGAGAGDACPTPQPPCCFTVPEGAALRCECWPIDSAACANVQRGQQPGAMLVASCPPA